MITPQINSSERCHQKRGAWQSRSSRYRCMNFTLRLKTLLSQSALADPMKAMSNRARFEPGKTLKNLLKWSWKSPNVLGAVTG